jgi:tetratricopeptide (TPR) repeat protein
MKMKNNISRLVAIILPLTIAVTGCQKSFIERSDPTRLYSGDYINSVESFKGAITAAYGTLQPVYNQSAGASFQLFGDVVSDNATAQTGGPQLHLADHFTFDSSFSPLSIFWNASYRSIAECNIILTRGPKVVMDANLQNRYLAEAKFIRALNYFNLVRIYGDVPLVTTELVNYKDAYEYGRQPVSTVYAQIIKDLTEASTVLSPSYTGADIGRATSWAAKALLGKVYLTQGKYTEALAELTAVIGSTKYTLLSNYNSVFDPANEMNSEIIFAVRYSRGAIGLGSGFGGNMLPSNSGTAIVPSGAPNGSYNSQMPELAALYAANDNRKAISTGFYAAGQPTAYYSQKFIDKVTTSSSDAENDWIVIRYADVLLMQAEALNELNRTLEAEPYLNLVHQRALPTPIVGLSQANMRLAIENERRLELSFEGHRWFDLVRTGRAIAVMNAHFAANATFYGGTIYTVKPNQLIFPIPLTEIQTNPKLTQNP